MKITKVDIMHIKPRNAPQWHPIACRIFTDEGIFGDGEAGMTYASGGPAAFGMVKDLAALIIGMDPLDNEVIWDKLYKSTFWGQNGGPVVFSGISAIDFALWDIKGKFFNVPVYKLLGGKKRDKLRSYASQLQFGWGGTPPAVTPEQFAFNSKFAVSQGYDCIKIDYLNTNRQGQRLTSGEQTRLQTPEFVSTIEDRIAATREAVGPNVDIILENHALTDALSAVQLGQMAEKYNMFYYEETCTPTPKMMKYVHDNVNIPIASGERIYSRWQYAQYFENLSLQVIQPDFGNTGGITEGKKICDMAYVYDASVQAHVCGTGIANAVSLQVECVIPNFVIHEHNHGMLQSYNTELCIYDYQPEGGMLVPPEIPGIGNEWSEYALTNCDKVTVG